MINNNDINPIHVTSPQANETINPIPSKLNALLSAERQSPPLSTIVPFEITDLEATPHNPAHSRPLEAVHSSGALIPSRLTGCMLPLPCIAISVTIGLILIVSGACVYKDDPDQTGLFILLGTGAGLIILPLFTVIFASTNY